MFPEATAGACDNMGHLAEKFASGGEFFIFFLTQCKSASKYELLGVKDGAIFAAELVSLFNSGSYNAVKY
jgi:hypothetical protein